MQKKWAVTSAVLILAGCSARTPTQSSNSVSLNPGAAAAAYAPRVGIAVTTAGRTCLAIRNGNLALNSPVTLVMPNLPQTFTQAQIGSTSDSPCPITKDVDRNVSNYELHLPGGTESTQKLVPMIAVVGPATNFLLTNTTVQADIQQDGTHQLFRSCSADDGVHLTVWSGTPLTAPMLWQGYYYTESNPGVGPACTPGETHGL